MASLCVADAPFRSAVGCSLALPTPTLGSGIDVLVPVLVAVDLALHRREEHLLDPAGDGSGLPDLAVVDGADGHDLGRRPREEGLVGRVEVGAEDVAGGALDAEV